MAWLPHSLTMKYLLCVCGSSYILYTYIHVHEFHAGYQTAAKNTQYQSGKEDDDFK